MAKITAARKAAHKQARGNLARASKALAPKATGPKPLKTITPGTVLILVAGAHKGKRVVFLKQLASGLLLVTGPFKINGVPVRRVNKVYAIATATKVELPAAVTEAIAEVDDKFFETMKANVKKAAAAAEREATKNGTAFIAHAAKKPAFVNTARVELQKKVDAALCPAIQAVGREFVQYLGSHFSLRKGQYPHALKF